MVVKARNAVPFRPAGWHSGVQSRNPTFYVVKKAIRVPAPDEPLNKTGLLGPTRLQVPDGDTRERRVCPDCGYIEYDNPKIVVGAVCAWEGRILMCTRSIPPRTGFWTFPAGFMEVHESLTQGAAREVREEACAEAVIGDLIGVYEIPAISQVQMFWRADLTSGACAPGEESASVALIAPDDLPWDKIAFPAVKWALERYLEGPGLPPLFHTAEKAVLD